MKIVEALEPFVALGELLRHDRPDDHVFGIQATHGTARVTAGDFVRVADALAQVSLVELRGEQERAALRVALKRLIRVEPKGSELRGIAEIILGRVEQRGAK